MVYNHFYMLLHLLVFCYEFCVYIHREHGPVLLFSFDVFARFWYQGNDTGFIVYFRNFLSSVFQKSL